MDSRFHGNDRWVGMVVGGDDGWAGMVVGGSDGWMGMVEGGNDRWAGTSVGGNDRWAGMVVGGDDGCRGSAKPVIPAKAGIQRPLRQEGWHWTGGLGFSVPEGGRGRAPGE